MRRLPGLPSTATLQVASMASQPIIATDAAGRLTYILPLRSRVRADTRELTGYLKSISNEAELIVVDGSAPQICALHAQAWGSFLNHIAVDQRVDALNGKVAGVITGLGRATGEYLVIADDDVRYDADGLSRIREALRYSDVVRPQNYFSPLPPHALWDTGRILLNRALGGDWPGTLGVRRDILLATKGYDGDVLFENLEMVRTVTAAGGTEMVARSLFVKRTPPTFRHFLSQRIRQAYDEFARPRVFLAELAILPALMVLFAQGRGRSLIPVAISIMLLAAWGRERDGGAKHFPLSACLFAPLWVAERATCAWLALGYRFFRGGMPYGSGVLRRAATPIQELNKRYSGLRTSRSMGLKEPLLESSAEQAVTPTIMSISERSSR